MNKNTIYEGQKGQYLKKLVKGTPPVWKRLTVGYNAKKGLKPTYITLLNCESPSPHYGRGRQSHLRYLIANSSSFISLSIMLDFQLNVSTYFIFCTIYLSISSFSLSSSSSSPRALLLLLFHLVLFFFSCFLCRKFMCKICTYIIHTLSKIISFS